jgi:ferric-dicitrate binding protein FerR (iron transport regulator)
MNPFGSDNQEWTDLARYLADELPLEERARVEREAGPALLAEAQRIWLAAGEIDGHWDATAGLAAIKRKAAMREPVTFSVRRREPLLRFSAAAAIAVISLGAGWFLTRRAATPSADEQGPPPMTELATLPGQRADLLLPDGSRVTLGMASRLRYPVRYAGNSRDLYLDGEAYFQVVRDTTMPFRVHTRRGVTEDLGTAFDVRAFGGGPLAVVVAEGAVVLRSTPTGETDGLRESQVTDSLLLSTADLGSIDAGGKLTLRRDVDVDSYLAWRQDRLVFRDAPLREVLERLHAWYGMDIELGDSTLAQRKFTATFDAEPASRVLDQLSLIVQVRYEHRGALTLVYPATQGRAATR